MGDELSEWEGCRVAVLLIVAVETKVLFQGSVDPFYVTVG